MTTKSRQELDDFFWADLLDYIDDGRVIPVVDAGAMQVDDAAGTPFEALVARRLADRLRVDLSDLSRPPRLDDVVARHLQTSSGAKGVLYGRTLQVVRELDVAPPRVLLDLAAIPRFDLFVTVSFDGLLQRALDVVRHGGAARCDVISYAPNRPVDLPAPRAQLLRPTVFHLFGKLSTAPDSVICDDDRLEFLHALQDDVLRPKLLFDELRDNHLLLLGCRLPDWAARFFLRTAKNERLSVRRSETFEYLVGPEVAEDTALAAFLADFSRATRLVAWRPEDFVATLRQRWEERHPPEEPVASASRAIVSEPSAGVVFISYSRQDIDAARRLARSLDASGIDVWFDEQELKPGDAWERRILRGIETSALFVPLISQATQREDRRRAFFWREWNLADELARGMAPGESFILPVAVDDTDPYRAIVPDRFNSRQWTVLPGGEPSAAFIDIVKDLYRAFQGRAARLRT